MILDPRNLGNGTLENYKIFATGEPLSTKSRMWGYLLMWGCLLWGYLLNVGVSTVNGIVGVSTLQVWGYLLVSGFHCGTIY